MNRVARLGLLVVAAMATGCLHQSLRTVTDTTDAAGGAVAWDGSTAGAGGSVGTGVPDAHGAALDSAIVAYGDAMATSGMTDAPGAVLDSPMVGYGGAMATSGMTGVGGATSTSGARGAGGAPGAVTGTGGANLDAPLGTGNGGLAGEAGGTVRGGAPGSGGVTALGGATGSGGTAEAGNTTTFDPTQPPCDIYAEDGGPCVAAHSTVRRLFSAYNGPLYQVRVGGSNSGAGGTTTDIGFIAATGLADSAAQDTACGSLPCTISKIYDQSGNGNDLARTPVGGGEKPTADNEASATAVYLTMDNGQRYYGVHIVAGVGYRNIAATGTATGDNPETEYMVASATYYNGACCFDYGNMETSIHDDGEGSTEAVYFGNCTIWNEGGGNGPWVMADLENGLWAGDVSPYNPNPSIPSDWQYVTGMVKSDKTGTHHWSIKEGNAQSSTLNTVFDGLRPGGADGRYWTMKKEGAIGLGTAGDNSDGDHGDFFEGIMTASYSSDEADRAVQTNIASVYGQVNTQ